MRYMKMCMDTGKWVQVKEVRRRRTSWACDYCLYVDNSGNYYCTMGDDPVTIMSLACAEAFDLYVDELEEGME